MFSEQEIRDILSRDHLANTARGLNKDPDEVTADDLIVWWKRWHTGSHILFYDVEPVVSDKDNPLFV